ncbi:TetR/AcrR family transcriptional regulator [Streptomyces djakartensis]|uniref:TetR/AcrR family transcriptional regulator n=1 Tax=Streptomyces djakartensis TaxID=68193 RepID=UPI0034DF0F7B
MGRAADLTRERIAVEALALLDEAGAAGMTMRKVADRLGVKAPSIYYHFESQDELIEAVHQLVVQEIDRSGFHEPDWRTGLANVARSYRDTFVRHGEAVALVSRRPVSGDEALGFYDDLVRVLLRHQVPVERALVLVGTLDFLVLGSAVETFTAGFDQPAQAYAVKQPKLAEALAAAALTTVDDEAFDIALEAWLNVVAVNRTTRDS